jgi:hypothetical protein
MVQVRRSISTLFGRSATQLHKSYAKVISSIITRNFVIPSAYQLTAPSNRNALAMKETDGEPVQFARRPGTDPALLGVVALLAALSAVLVVTTLALPALVYPSFLTPILVASALTLVLCFCALNWLYFAYLDEKGVSFRKNKDGPVKFRKGPLWLTWATIEVFSISLLFLVTGVFLRWAMQWDLQALW